MAVKENVKSHADAVDYFKEPLFCIKHIERLKNIDQLSELPFYEELNVIKTDMHLGGMQEVKKSNQLRKKTQLNSEKQVNQVQRLVQ